MSKRPASARTRLGQGDEARGREGPRREPPSASAAAAPTPTGAPGADALETAYERTRQVLERVTDGVCALDREWRFTYVNAAAERMLKRRRAELLGAVAGDLFPPTDDAAVNEAIRRAMWEGVAADLEFYYPPLQAWLEVRYYPAADGVSICFRDVTERRRLAEELRASEGRFRTLVEQLPVVVYEQANDARRTATYFSPQLETLTGYTMAEIMARPEAERWLGLVHPDDRARVAEIAGQSRATGQPFRTQYRLIRRDGSAVWVQDECAPLRDRDGVIVAWQGVLFDITDRMEAEETRAHLAAIVEAAEDGILSVGRDGTILSWNRGAERIYGFRADEALGQSVAILRPPEQAAQIAREFAEVWAGASIERHETTRLHKDGRRIPVSLSIFPLRDGEGRVVAASSITHDLSPLQRARDAVRLRNRALDATQAGIIITDPAQPDNPIIDANPAFTRLTGYARDEVLGRNCRLLQGPDTDPTAVQRLREAIAAGEDVRVTILNYRKNGDAFWNDLSIAAVHDAQGALTHFVGVVVDATDRKRMEHDLRQALDEARAGMRAKDQFLAMMSHELRTPLQAVLGYADFLLHAGTDPLTSEQRLDVEAIHQGARRMATLVDQLLDLSRMEAGRLELRSERVDLARILEEVQQDLAPQVASKGLAFRIAVPAGLPAARGDRDRVRQVLLNVAGNAVKFTERGGVAITVDAEEDWVRARVTDTGIGIAPEALPRVFEEFRQIDSQLSRRHGGAGLGLAISRKLTELMGGQIAVESELGSGTTFTIRLPRDDSAKTGAGDAAATLA